MAARPADLDQVGFGGRARAEVQPQIVLRDIAAAAPDLVDLRVAASHHADARPDFGKNRRRTGVTTADANSVSRTNKRKQREQACKPNFVPREPEVAIIRLAPALLPGSSDLPESSLL